MVEKIIPLLAAVAAPLIGLLVSANRRNRLVGRIRTYRSLAEELVTRHPESAASVDELVADTVIQLVESDRRAMTRSFQPASFVAFLLFLVPAGLGAYFAWTNSGWWTWPVLLLCFLWTVVVAAAAWSEVFPHHEQPAPAQ